PSEDCLAEAATTTAGIREPRHGQIRRIINSVVAFHKSQRIEPYLQDLTARLLDDVHARAAVAGDAGGDGMAGLADAVPPAAMAHLLGFPEADALAYYRWADEIGTRF